MAQMNPAEMILRVPGERAYTLVIRTMLGGVAMLKDLDLDAMDDLRVAADEACDCLLNQGASVRWLELSVREEDGLLTVSLEAEADEPATGAAGDPETSRAVLETLIPRVGLTCVEGGFIRRIDLTLPKAADGGAHE